MQKNWFKTSTYIILFVAISLRIIGYFRQTSFFLDEANLARNIAEKSFFDLFFPLEYQQYAPPFFAQFCKATAEIFGYSEMGLRVFPFLAGIVSLVLFYQLLKALFDSKMLIYPLLLFVFNVYLYRHGLELKQYSIDVLVTISWLLIAIKKPLLSQKEMKWFAFLGMLTIWFSMSSVFVLAGVGLYFLANKISQSKHSFSEVSKLFVENSALVLMILCWLFSFGFLFFINLQHGIQTDGLQNYHSPYFLSFTDWAQSTKVKIGLFRAIVGKTTLALGWAILCLYAGLYQIWKTQKQLLWLLVIPIATCFFASTIQYYSLIIRLGLFLFPIFIIIIGLGVVFLIELLITSLQKNNVFQKAALFVVLFLMFFSLIHRSALPYFTHEFVTDNPREVLEKLADKSTEKTPLFVSHFGQTSFDFYTKHYKKEILINSYSVDYADYPNNLKPWLKKQKKEGINQVWIYDSHTYGKDKENLEQTIQSMGRIKEHISAKFSDAYLVILK